MAQPSFSIRQAEPGDLDQIWEIEAAVFGTDAWSRSMLEEELTAEHRSYFVLVAAGDDSVETVHGYAGLLALGTDGDVQTIAVAPSARGTGQGRRLMDELLTTARSKGVRDVFLEVRADNPVARGLYETLGFTELGVRPRYYQPDGVDAIVMKLQLKDHA